MAFAMRSPVAISEINVTPLIDVLLVLLIVFLLAAPRLSTQITLQLPQPVPPDRIIVQPDPIAVAIGAQGELTWNGQHLPREALAPQLRLEAGRVPQAALQLTVDSQAAFEDAAIVLAAAQNAGLRSIGFAQPR